MSEKILDKTRLNAFLDTVKKDFAVWVPAERNGIVDFRPHDADTPPELTRRARASTKKFFQPQRETLFCFAGQGFAAPCVECADVPPPGKTAVFGVRPCDARAMVLDALVFVDDPANPHEDEFFRQRRDDTVLFGLGCKTPGGACFCNRTGGDPFGEDGLDVIFTELSDAFLVKPLTEKGEKAIAGFPLEAAGQAAIESASKAAGKARASMADGLDFARIAALDVNLLFELPLWDETAEYCLNCGVCTYLCPTCICFDVLDQTNSQGGKRLRTWDSCMSAQFTLHASGHNPRPTGRERVRQRFLHKLKYFLDVHDGRVSCVGCGRCVQHCPVNIDIREIAERMASAANAANAANAVSA